MTDTPKILPILNDVQKYLLADIAVNNGPSMEHGVGLQRTVVEHAHRQLEDMGLITDGLLPTNHGLHSIGLPDQVYTIALFDEHGRPIIMRSGKTEGDCISALGEDVPCRRWILMRSGRNTPITIVDSGQVDPA